MKIAKPFDLKMLSGLLTVLPLLRQKSGAAFIIQSYRTALRAFPELCFALQDRGTFSLDPERFWKGSSDTANITAN